ncbi:hypothetical protein PAZ_c21310 [Cutibacterium acnes 266]|nr:hypothetical protein PAZ_c21310 [Cutibacterium acnes 266]
MAAILKSLNMMALAAFSITGLPAATGMMFLIRGSIARGVAGSASKSADAA